jgi:hypothetical protein
VTRGRRGCRCETSGCRAKPRHTPAGGVAEQGAPPLRPGSLSSPGLRSVAPCSGNCKKGGKRLNQTLRRGTPLGDTVRESGCPLTAGIWVSLDIVLEREVDVQGGPAADVVDEGKGVTTLQHHPSRQLVVGKHRDHHQPTNLRKVHTPPRSTGPHSTILITRYRRRRRCSLDRHATQECQV